MKVSKKNLKKAGGSRGILDVITANYRYIIIGAVFVILIIIMIAVSGGEKKESSENKTEETAQEQTAEETTAEDETEVEEPANDLQTDVYPEVNGLVNSYFASIINSDTAALGQILPGLSEEEKNMLAGQREYIESYNNVVCYTKTGPIENSYIVFAYHEIKFLNINTMAPGLEPLYVLPDEAGKLYAVKLSAAETGLDADTEAYIGGVLDDEDVILLSETVNGKFQEAQAADPALKAFVEQLGSVSEGESQTE